MIALFLICIIGHYFLYGRCKEELLLTAYPDGMMRAHYSKRCQRDAPDCKKWTEAFFQKRSDQEFLLSKIRQHVGEHFDLRELFNVTILWFLCKQKTYCARLCCGFIIFET